LRKYDERDTIFSRMARKEFTNEYNDYYSKNSEKEIIDKNLRKNLPIASKGKRFYEPLKSPIVDAAFNLLSDLKKFAECNSVFINKTEGSAEEFTEIIKETAKLYGAEKIGITKSDSQFYYSHRGRTDDVYGNEINYGELPNTIVFAVPMNEKMIKKAPKTEESIATTHGYVQSAIVALMVAYTIRQWGYNARAHIDGNYLNILPIAAEIAGIGELGMHGLLITEEFGPKIRLSGVSTDIPLVYDMPSKKEQEKICLECMKCVKACPSKAITGNFGMPINSEKCFGKWLEFGTDCGVCLSVCSNR